MWGYQRGVHLRRVILAFGLLAVVAMDIAMAAVGVAGLPAFFSQNGAGVFSLEPVVALQAYAVAIVLLARVRSAYWDALSRSALVYGVMTGMIEVINLGVENGIPFAVNGPFTAPGFMLIIFTLWGIAAFRATIHRCRLGSRGC